MSLSSKPYLIRALYDWMTDNNLTPQILVNATMDGVNVPSQFFGDDRLLLNIGLTATRELILGDSEISFSARFGGVSHSLRIPISAVLAVLARETEALMVFGNEPALKISDEVELGDSNLSDSVKEGSVGDETIVKKEALDDNVVHVQFGRGTNPKKPE